MRAFLLFGGLLMLSGCSPFPLPAPPDGGTEADSPLARRFASDTLPWLVSADATARGMPVTAGVSAQVAIREPRYRPVALSPTRLGVVFPPADRPGFDLAVGGLEQPWQREHLLDVRAADVASLDAIADGAGGAWVALRLLDRRQKVVLVHWGPGQAVSVERLDWPVGLNPVPAPYLEQCNDLTLGRAPSGALDLVLRADPNPLEPVLFRGRRATPGSPFVWEQVVDGRKARAPVLQGSAWDFGCKSALTYDGLGRALLAVLVLQTSFTTQGLTGRSVRVFTEGRDGRLWAKETAFMTIGEEQPSELRGLFDVASHPSGFVFGGPAVAFQDVPAEATVENPEGETPFVYLDAYHPSFPLDTAFVGDRQLASDYRFALGSGERLIARQTPSQPVPRRGGKLLADGCGQFALAVTDWDAPNEWVFQSLGKRCDDPSPAPVFRARFSGRLTAAFAHGYEPPYSVGVCLDEAQQLGVCFGGHEGLEQPPTPLEQLEANPLVSINLTPGQRDVPVTHVLEVEFSAPLRTPGAAAQVYDLRVADLVRGDWRLVSGARFAFTPSSPWKPQNAYRVVVPVQNRSAEGPPVLKPWQTPDGRARVVDFTTGGEGPPRVDVWAQPFGVTPQVPRSDAGEPELFFDDAALTLLGTERLRLGLTGRVADDFGRTPLDAGRILRADGGALIDPLVPILLDAEWIDVPPPRDAGELEAFVVELPVFFDRHGRAFEDHRVWVKTGYFPLRVTGTTPADGSSVGTPPAFVSLQVNRPDAAQRLNATSFSLEQLSAPGGTPVASVPFVVEFVPFEVRLRPMTALAPGSYRVTSFVTVPPRVESTFTVGP